MNRPIVTGSPPAVGIRWTALRCCVATILTVPPAWDAHQSPCPVSQTSQHTENSSRTPAGRAAALASRPPMLSGPITTRNAATRRPVRSSRSATPPHPAGSPMGFSGPRRPKNAALSCLFMATPCRAAITIKKLGAVSTSRCCSYTVIFTTINSTNRSPTGPDERSTTSSGWRCTARPMSGR
jgi:hypothetical protein